MNELEQEKAFVKAFMQNKEAIEKDIYGLLYKRGTSIMPAFKEVIEDMIREQNEKRLTKYKEKQERGEPL